MKIYEGRIEMTEAGNRQVFTVQEVRPALWASLLQFRELDVIDTQTDARNQLIISTLYVEASRIEVARLKCFGMLTGCRITPA